MTAKRLAAHLTNAPTAGEGGAEPEREVRVGPRQVLDSAM